MMILKHLSYWSHLIFEVEVKVECGDSSKDSIDYNSKPDAAVFIEKGAGKTKNK